MPRTPFRFVMTVLLISPLLYSTACADWPYFRGPAGNGTLAELNHPIAWGDGQSVAWKKQIPGNGWSSPVIVGDRVFVTTAVSDEVKAGRGFGEGVASMRSFLRAEPPKQPVSFEVHCLSLSDGSTLWKKTVAKQRPQFVIHPSNTYATESPATDGENIYAYFAAIGKVACLNLEGDEQWQRDLGAYPTSNNFGTGSALTLHEGRVFVQCDNQEKSFITAIDAKTGDDVWTVNRREGTAWSSPSIWKNRKRAELILCGPGYVTSYDPASGEVLWNMTGMGGSFSSSPTSDSDRLYFGYSGRASRGPLVAVNAGATGELTLESKSDEGLAWVQDASGPGMASPVALQGRVYVVSRGVITCHDAASGERVFRSRLPGASNIAASLWAEGDQIMALDESGSTYVIDAGAEFKIRETNKLSGTFWSTPSVGPKELLLRSSNWLYCIR